jgi:DNA-entry nuclease
VDGMLPFENMVADYIKETNNHVMYRVTPIFEGDNLVVSGVQMEALSVEDEGEGISYNVFVYNVQPGIEIDYATGDSKESGDTSANTTKNTTASTSANVQSGTKKSKTTYILNTGTMKFHLPSCSSVSDMSSGNKKTYKGTRAELIEKGYDACGRCKP